MITPLAQRIAKYIKPALVGCIVLLLGAGTVLHTSSSAYAQDSQLRPWLRKLFSPRRAERVEPPAKVPQKQRPKTSKPRTRATAPNKPSATAAPPTPVIEKDADARIVLVVGDFMASGLADGLTTVFAENATIRVVDRSNGSSGLVRDDYYNWPGEISAILKAEKPAVVLIMMGSNDRQQIKVGETRKDPQTEDWKQEYKKRTLDFGKYFSDANLPFLWVGMPSFRPGTMTSDMLALNEIYREAAENTGGEFVDIWEGFVDENGVFIARGPDINGQPVALRTEDGINMTGAGKRKVAFYTEKPLLKLLDIVSPNATTAAPEALATLPDILKIPINIDRTQPMLLNDPALDGGTELLGASISGIRKTAKKPEENSKADKSVAGRADNFNWPLHNKAAVASPDLTTGSLTGND